MSGDTLIVATEPHIIHQMELAMPGKTFIGAPGADGNCNCNICPYMALNTLEKLYLALRDLTARSRSRKACAWKPRRASTPCWPWPAARWAKAILAGPERLFPNQPARKAREPIGHPGFFFRLQRKIRAAPLPDVGKAPICVSNRNATPPARFACLTPTTKPCSSRSPSARSRRPTAS
jgi:hypothetical protein